MMPLTDSQPWRMFPNGASKSPVGGMPPALFSDAAIFMPGIYLGDPYAGGRIIQYPQGEYSGLSNSGFEPPVPGDVIKSTHCIGNAELEGFSMADHATGLSALTLADISTISHEPRIRDVRIGERLGMAQPLDIRRTIEANRAELERYGEVFARRPKTSAKGGRPATAYYLNEPQTLLLCMLSRTERAADVRQEVISVYMAYRQGAAPAAITGDLPTDDGRYVVRVCGRRVASVTNASSHCLVNGHDPVSLTTFIREYAATDALPAVLDVVLRRMCFLARTDKFGKFRNELLRAVADASAALAHHIPRSEAQDGERRMSVSRTSKGVHQ